MRLSRLFALLLACASMGTPGSCATTVTVRFDGQRAWQHLVRQIAFGPRVPESQAIHRTRAYILSELGACGLTTGSQGFRANAEVLGREIQATNLYGICSPGMRSKFVLSAHYDTRPIADREKTPERRAMPIPGANDGASGAAVLLELARVFAAMQPRPAVALVFFDAEDLGQPMNDKGFCLGSRYMAAHMPPELDFETGINVDMVGDADLRIPVERFSLERATEIADSFAKHAARLHPEVFTTDTGTPVFDDHMPFLQTGRKYINVIDFEYPYWHTLHDTADKCSPQSLQTVGETIASFVGASF